MKWSALLFAVLLLLAIVSALTKQFRLAATQKVLRLYNESKDLTVITNWIREKRPAIRLLYILDYLQKIEEEQLAVEIISAFDMKAFQHRHIRIFACKAFLSNGMEKKALTASRGLLKSFPKDDSILELYIDVHLTCGDLENARTALMPRLDKKAKGTVFARQYARLVAADGDVEKAIEIVKKIVAQDYSLYKNTFAPAQKRLIYEQYVASQTLLNKLEGKDPPSSETKEREKPDQPD